MSDDEAYRNLVKVRDPNRLLEGEVPRPPHISMTPSTGSPSMVEVLGFKENVVEAAGCRRRASPEDAQPEAGADLTILEAERQRLERRYRFWETRVEQLRVTTE